MSVFPIGLPFTSRFVFKISFSMSARSFPRASRYPTWIMSQGMLSRSPHILHLLIKINLQRDHSFVCRLLVNHHVLYTLLETQITKQKSHMSCTSWVLPRTEEPLLIQWLQRLESNQRRTVILIAPVIVRTWKLSSVAGFISNFFRILLIDPIYDPSIPVDKKWKLIKQTPLWLEIVIFLFQNIIYRT